MTILLEVGYVNRQVKRTSFYKEIRYEGVGWILKRNSDRLL
jgi:hypothetical protein